MSFACIDFETANRKRSSACRLGIAIVSEGAIQRSESWLIRPTPFEFEPINISKHGITVEQLICALAYITYCLGEYPQVRDFPAI